MKAASTLLKLPAIPTPYVVAVFTLLVLLLVLREVRAAMGKPGSRRWRVISDSLLGMLVLVYGFILISRFINLLQ
jgi:hypothetical protein